MKISLLESLSQISWLAKCLLMPVILSIFPLFMTFMKHRGYPGEMSLNWYYTGVCIGLFALAATNSGAISAGSSQIFSPWWAPLLALAYGLTLGVILNLLFAQATTAPGVNPALPLALQESSAVIVYLLAPLLHFLLPSLFPAASANWKCLSGVVLTISGVVLIARYR